MKLRSGVGLNDLLGAMTGQLIQKSHAKNLQYSRLDCDIEDVDCTFEEDPMSGKELNRLWRVGAQHALYHKDGTWFNNLKRFPGALFDRTGYVMFCTQQEYIGCEHVRVTQETNVPGGISSMPTYKFFRST